AEFEAQHPEVRLRPDFSCPPCLLTSRMGEGVEMDLFISAGDVERDLLAARGLLDPATTQAVGSAALVLAVPPDNPANVRALGDLHRAEVKQIAVGDPERTSPGRYARQALERMGLWSEVEAKLVLSKTGCEALKSVMLGQAEAALLYDFCLHGEADEPHQVQRVPGELHDPITLGLTAAPARSGPALESFFEFMQSPVAQAALRRAGIGPPPAPVREGK
ncbi:MAG: molybdate ABC transporter substrate-binding protein, partial [Armatimonadetes bacterium]|nr:molybdate ABC transporter substrate-binding protein [Armatimonadota bacterium]